MRWMLLLVSADLVANVAIQVSPGALSAGEMRAEVNGNEVDTSNGSVTLTAVDKRLTGSCDCVLGTSTSHFSGTLADAPYCK